MRALVTGGGGFLGKEIVRQLMARGNHVRSLARGDYPELRAWGVETIRADLRDARGVRNACQGVDTVFHTAALAGIWGPWRDFYEVNVLGTRHLLQACRAAGVPRLVFTSSPSVTFDGGHQSGVDESAPYARRWLCHYPHTKALAEQAVLAADGVDGVATCALRPHLIWGPGDTQLVPRLWERARRGQLLRVGDGRNRVDTIHVENAARAHLLADDALKTSGRPAGRAYFISQGVPVNCWEWIDQLLELAGLPPVQRSISFRAAWLAGTALETAYRLCGCRSEPRMSRFLAAQLARDHFFDIGRARRDLGYEALLSAEEGLARWRARLVTAAAPTPAAVRRT